VILNRTSSLVGVFRTSEPLGYAADGTQCHILLRFYEDGFVLHASLCKNVESKWDEIEKWFNRDVAMSDEEFGIGVGKYTIKGSQVEFSTVTYDRECQMRIELEHSGTVVGGSLRVRTKLVDDPQVYEREFVPLRAAQI
jgi:hypothetical protein